MSAVRISSALWLAVASGGLIVTSSAFVFLYAAIGIGCMVGWHLIDLAGTNLLTAVLVVIWVVHLAALGGLQWFAVRLWPRATGPDEGAARFLAAMTCLLAATGILATIFIGFPVLVLPPCAA